MSHFNRNNKHSSQSLLTAASRRGFPTKPLVVAAGLLSCVLTAVAIAPDTMPAPLTSTQIQTLSTPDFQSIDQPSTASFWREEPIRSGDSLAGMLARLGLDDDEAMAFIRSDVTARKIFSQLRPGRYIRLETGSDGSLRSMRYPVSGTTEMIVFRERGRLFATEQPIVIEKRLMLRSATIKTSLLEATDSADIPESIAFQIADILDTKIDFIRDLRAGDHFSVIYEAEYNRGRIAGAGKIVALEFSNKGKIYQAVRFDDGSSEGAYYTPDFKPLKSKAGFLRSPLEFSRISSTFGGRRHPIFQDWRAHKGVDYAAPTGTRIRTTAEGTVRFAGTQRGYGNVVIISHPGRFETLYAHMSSIASGIRGGAKVSQGQIIGSVGATGWATGPHLHYEVRKAGNQVNPLDESIVIALDNGAMARQKKAFEKVKTSLMATLTLVKTTGQTNFN